MSKGIELTPTQIEACEVGATMFLFPINAKELKMSEIGLIKHLLQFSPVQKGDKDIFVQEEGIFTTYHRCYKIDADKNLRSDLTFEEKLDYSNINWQPASQMTKEQSRYLFIECIDIKIVKIQTIRAHEILRIFGNHTNRHIYLYCDFRDYYNQQLKEQNINRTYEDNDYVFLIEFKR